MTKYFIHWGITNTEIKLLFTNVYYLKRLFLVKNLLNIFITFTQYTFIENYRNRIDINKRQKYRMMKVRHQVNLWIIKKKANHQLEKYKNKE